MFLKLLRAVVLGLIVEGILFAELAALRMGSEARYNQENNTDEKLTSLNKGGSRAVHVGGNDYKRSAQSKNNRGINNMG